MKRAFKHLTVLLAAFLLSACAKDTTSFSLLSDSDSFEQDGSSKLAVTKVDILWVIDNSGSMQTSQDALADNFDSFINDFTSKNLDFQIAVAGTDAWRYEFGASADYAKLRQKDPHDAIMTPDTLDLVNVFKDNIRLGTSGTGDERAFQSLKTALSYSGNSDFLRDDSFLSVIIVSDEDDFSHDDAFGIYSNDDPDLHDPNDYVNFLDTATGSTPTNRRYSVSAMAIWTDACRDSLNTTWTGRIVGDRMAQLVDATGGTKGDLCGNFADELEFISESVLTQASRFYLSRIPKIETISVVVNGVAVPKTEDNGGKGWRYDATTNSIEFVGSEYVPQQGATIDITYDPVAYGS